MDSGLATGDAQFEHALKASPCGIGDEQFRQWASSLWAQALGKRQGKEDVAFRRVPALLQPGTVLGEVARGFGVQESMLGERHRNLPARAAAAQYLIRWAGRTQREAAARLGIGTGAAVCTQLKRLASMEAADRGLRGKLRRLEEQLQLCAAARKPRNAE